MLSFSDVTMKHVVDRLGVKIYRVDDIDPTFEKVISPIRNTHPGHVAGDNQILYADKKWDHDYLCQSLGRYDAYVFKNVRDT